MLRYASSLGLFFSICALLGAAFIYQTIFNRGASVYGSAWFMALGLALAANIAACSLRRIRTARLHFTLLHAGLVVVIAGGFVTRYTRFEAALPLHAGEYSDMSYTETASYRLPFSVKLTDFRIEYYVEPAGLLTLEENGSSRTLGAAPGAEFTAADGTVIKILRTLRDFGLGHDGEAADKSPYWHNPAAQVEIVSGKKREKAWLFANFPSPHGEKLPYRLSYSVRNADIKNYHSSVRVRSGGGPETAAVVSVNSPLKVGGYTLYQTSYDPANAAYTLLTVTLDRGVWVVYAGFAMFLTGVLLWLR